MALQQITGQINRIINSAKVGSETVIQLALAPIFERSLELCPEDTGELRNSAELTTVRTGDKVRGEISYGNAFAWYAAIVHEVMWFHHDPPTQAKYLQQAMEEGVDDLPQRLQALYRELLGMSR